MRAYKDHAPSSKANLALVALVVAAALGLGLAGCKESTKDVREQAPVSVATTIAQTGTAAAQGQQAVLVGTTTTESLDVDGLTRDAIVYVPARLPAGQPVPLILFLHGTPGRASSVASLGLSEEADRRGFIAVYPNGDRGGWNDWESSPFDWSQADDVGFFTRLLDALAVKYSIDATRIFVMGYSNGGGMTYRLACALSERIAAIAVVAGPLVPAECKPGRLVSVLHIHGTRDVNVPYAGAIRPGGTLPPPSGMSAFWRTHNGCASEPMTRMVTAVVEREASGSCRDGTEVALYTIKNGGHCWPRPTVCTVGDPDKALDATPLIVDFLLAHPRSAAEPRAP